MGLLLVLLAANFAEPTVVSTNNEWGEITHQTSEVRTAVTVGNPNDFGIPNILVLSYEVRLNSVTMATGERRGVGFPAGRSTVTLSTQLDNSQIAPWWRTHVERDERSTLVVDPSVSIPWLPLELDLPPEREQFDTAIVRSVNEEGTKPITLADDVQVVQSRMAATWGVPTTTRTPLTLSITLQNRHDERVTVEYVEYRIWMNGIGVGAGPVERTATVGEGGQTTVEVTIYILNDRMNAWWVSHLRNAESTAVQIELGGTVRLVESDQTERFDRPVHNASFTTDILG